MAEGDRRDTARAGDVGRPPSNSPLGNSLNAPAGSSSSSDAMSMVATPFDSVTPSS